MTGAPASVVPTAEASEASEAGPGTEAGPGPASAGTEAGSRPGSAGTSTGPTVLSTLRSARGPVLVASLLSLVLIATALLSRTGTQGRLEPRSYAPSGARALSELLAARGVEVRRVDSIEQALAGTPRTLLLLPLPGTLTPSELARLRSRPGPLLALGADQAQVDDLGLDVDVAGPVQVGERRAACPLPEAVTAGTVDLGGFTYRPRMEGAVGCYALDARATLLRLPGQRVTLLGDGDLFTNDRLDRLGNAALGLGLLGTADEVRWLIPDPARTVPDGGQTSVGELLPDWVGAGALQLLVAAAVLALWRARRLGRVVPEPLPVVVRSAEAVEGRARLYRAAGARDQAAAALRRTAHERLGTRLGLPARCGPEPLVAAVVARTGRARPAVDVVLHGPPPVDDAALVRLADDLDALARDVAAGSSGGGSTA